MFLGFISCRKADDVVRKSCSTRMYVPNEFAFHLFSVIF